MEKVDQLFLFEVKGDFSLTDEFVAEYKPLFREIATAILEGFESFSRHINTSYSNTTRANMLNDEIISALKGYCLGLNFQELRKGKRRSVAFLADDIALFFKKHPISNVKTQQDDAIKNQDLSKHVLFVVYRVDDLWSKLENIEIQYLVAGNVVSSISIIDLASEISIEVPIATPAPVVRLKKDIQKKKSS